jgi:hypothetical protein
MSHPLFHGRAIALDVRDHCAPFATLFIIHEWRVRGFHPFQHAPSIPAEITWQQWISLSGVYDNDSGFIHDAADPLQDNNNNNIYQQVYQYQPSTSSGGPGGPTERLVLAPNNDIIANILAATHAQPSWRVCEEENTN